MCGGGGGGGESEESLLGGKFHTFSIYTVLGKRSVQNNLFKK